MLRYIAQRLAQAAVIVAIVAVITFALIHLAPGDPFTGVMDNPNVSETVRQTLRAQYGLDRPLPEQFVKYVNALAHGELGWSFSHERPVREVLATALPNTLLLMVVALVGSFALGIVTALVQVARRGSATDHALSGISRSPRSLSPRSHRLQSRAISARRCSMFCPPTTSAPLGSRV